MANTKKAVFTEFLPATSCTPEMREKIRGYAEKHNMSLAEVQRKAFSLFLRRVDSNTISNESTTSVERLELIGEN